MNDEWWQCDRQCNESCVIQLCVCVCISVRVIIDLYIRRHFVEKFSCFLPNECFCLSKNVIFFFLIIFTHDFQSLKLGLKQKFGSQTFWLRVNSVFSGNKRKLIKTRPRSSTRTLPSSGIQLVLWHQLISHYLYLTSKTRKNWPRGRKLLISHHVFHGFANASRTFKHEPKQKTLLWSL